MVYQMALANLHCKLRIITVTTQRIMTKAIYHHVH